MKPQEKAIHLYNRFESKFKTPFQTKQDCFFLVNEIMMCDAIYHGSTTEIIEERKYWNTVKAEIELL